LGMGNSIEVPEDVAARFATVELEIIQCKFLEMASEGSFRGRTFDKKTFQRHFVPDNPAIGGLIFKGIDDDGNGKINLEEFVRAMATFLRGTKAEQYAFIWKMFPTKGNKLSKAELENTLRHPFFGSEPSNFEKYDLDRDGGLNFAEFNTWCTNSPHVVRLLELFKQIDERITNRTNQSIQGPSQVKHVTHVTATEGGIKIDNIPPEWKALFIAAGATDAELNDPTTVLFLMQVVADRLGRKSATFAVPQSVPAVQQTPKPTENVADSNQTYGVFNSNLYTTSTPATSSLYATNQPASASPLYSFVGNPTGTPDSTSGASSLYAVSSTPSEPVQTQIPVAEPEKSVVTPPTQVSNPSKPPSGPGIPPPGPPPPGPPPPPIAAQPVKPIKKSSGKPSSAPKREDSYSALLESIRQSKQLRHVDPSETNLNGLSTADKNDLTNVLARALESVRGNLRADVDDENEEQDWDDD